MLFQLRGGFALYHLLLLPHTLLGDQLAKSKGVRVGGKFFLCISVQPKPWPPGETASPLTATQSGPMEESLSFSPASPSSVLPLALEDGPRPGEGLEVQSSQIRVWERQITD